MQSKSYLIVLLCFSSFCLSAQIEVAWTQTSFDYSETEDYLGVYPLVTFDDNVVLAHKLITRTIDEQQTWGFEFLEAATGNSTGDLITTNDIAPWNTINEDPELTDLVKTADGYLSFIRDRNRATFVKYDTALNAVESMEGSGIVEFNPSTFLFGYGLAESAASSYGMVGATWGRDENSTDNEATPHIFACDTDLNVRFARRLENAEYYLGNRFLIAVNDKDEIFTAGHTKGQELLRSDTVVISKLAADGELLYTNFLVLDPGSLPRVLKMDMNADGTELLLSGMTLFRDIFGNVTSKAYVARINAQDGALIKLCTFFAHQLGGTPSHSVELPTAQYDADGNIVLASLIINEAFDIHAIRMDLEGNIIDNTTIFSNLNGFPFPYSWRFNKVEDILYLSGSYPVEGGEKEAFVARLGANIVSTSVSENITVPISFKTSPNPTDGLLNIQWNNETNGEYQVKIINQLSQEIQTYKGTVFSGPMNLEFNIEHLPAGVYFVKLELENGFAVQSLVKK